MHEHNHAGRVMSQPTAYSRSTDFAAEERDNVGGRSTVRTAQVNAELDAIQLTLSQVLVNLALNQRDDGEIRDGRVKLFTLASDVLALLTQYGATPRGPWLTATAYALKDLVSQSGNTYIAVSAHTSGVFATDLAAGKWLLFSLSSSPGATQVTFTPTATVSATNVQAAIQEVDTEYRAADTTLSSLITTVSAEVSSLIADLANGSVAAKGDKMVASKRVALVNALATTIHDVNEYLPVNAVVNYQVPNDGVTDATPAIQRMFDDIRDAGVAAEIFFPPGTYLLLNPANETGEPRSYAAAVKPRGLTNCRISGMKGTKFTQGAGGAGAPQYAMFRFELCTNVEMSYFEADGSGIDIHTIGAARSTFAFYCNHDLDTKAPLAYPNRGLHIHHLKLDNFGGGICEATRTEAGFAYPLVTQGLHVHDIIGTNFTGQNHFGSSPYTENVYVHDCNIVNPLAGVAQIGNLFWDCSAGCVNALIENNIGVGFTGGGKAETHTGAGVASNEDRPSYSVTFSKNRFLECGDPLTMIFPGPGGGGWYGIKLNGINHAAIGNTLTARTTNATTGGLFQGIQLTSTAVTPVETIHTVFGNDVKGPVLGINHDSPSDTNHRYVAFISRNKIRDTIIPGTPIAGNDGTGIVCSRNALVEGNQIYRTKRSAVLIQTPDQTIVRDNLAYNCADTNNATIAATVVYSQAGSGAQGYFEFDNNRIIDTRGGSAAAYGYFLEGGTTYANKYKFNPGLTDGIVTGISFDTYFSAFGKTWVTSGMTTIPREFFATQSPQTGGAASLATWRKGDRAVNSNPAVGSPKAWICTVAGSPGTWVSEGNL